MRIKLPETESERLLLSLLITFIVYFGLNSLLFLFLYTSLFQENPIIMSYAMTVTFIISVLSGAGVFVLTGRISGKSGEEHGIRKSSGKSRAEEYIEKNMAILERVLSDDEILILRLITENEDITQDSLRFTTKFSKSKVSAIIAELEKNGLIYREKLGRTYKLYLANWLKK